MIKNDKNNEMKTRDVFSFLVRVWLVFSSLLLLESFFLRTKHCVAKEEEEEEEEEEACSSRLDWPRRVRSPSRIRGGAEVNGRAVSVRHPVRPQEWRGRGVTQK